VSGTFLDLAQDLIHDSDAKAAFDADPEAFLAARGFAGLSPEDLADAVGFVADTLPAQAAGQLTTDDLADASDPLARLARLEPSDAAADEPVPSVLLEGDPSGELDLPDGAEVSFAARAPTASTPEPDADDDAEMLRRVEEPEAEPGFGVGFSAEDVDDASPPGSALAEAADHELDVDFEHTHVPEMDLDAPHLPEVHLDADEPFGETDHDVGGEDDGFDLDDLDDAV
jgi:hypothetical protein